MVNARSSDRPPRVARLALCVVVALTSACGVGYDDGPRGIDSAAVPYQLLEEGTTVPARPTDAPPVAVTRESVFFYREGRLFPVTREVPAVPGDGQRDVLMLGRSVLEALKLGPTEIEANSGVRSALTFQAHLVNIDGETARIDIRGVFTPLPENERRIALAQMTFTITGVDGLTGVYFTFANAVLDVPQADGTLGSGPVNRDYFSELAATGSSVNPTTPTAPT